MRRIVLVCLAIFNLALIRPTFAQSPGLSFDSTNSQRATVLVMQTYLNTAKVPVTSCIGSGTFVSANGLILTNAHIALPSDRCKSDHLVISLNTHIGQPPTPTYYAQVVESNAGWDLAILKITTTLDGRPVNPLTLALPFVEVGDSEALHLDDTVKVVGFSLPGPTANGSSQIVPATISNFTEETQVSDLLGSRANKASGASAWLKVSADIPGNMSGGGAYGSDGKLIGIPTIEPALSGGQVANCRQIQDTNGDGVIDSKDGCVPVAGSINALRPSRLAQGLILAAELGITPAVRPVAKPEGKPSSAPIFSRLFFAPGVNNSGMPTTVISALPTGAKGLYLFFDYDSMLNGMIYELTVTQNGVLNPTFSLAPAIWNGGRRGMWYIGSSAQVWSNGVYEFTLFIQGSRVASQKIVVGGGGNSTPTFSDILFGVFTVSKQMINAGNVLPITDTINATFVYTNIPPNQAWCQRWYQNALEITHSGGAWSAGTNGSLPLNAGGQPLQPGTYRLELYLTDCNAAQPQLAATADFIMAGTPTASRANLFDNLKFSSASDLTSGQPTGPTNTTFANTISQLVTTFDWHSLGGQTPWTWRWSVDDHPLFEVTQSWGDDVDGSNFWLRLNAENHLPDGSYKIELLAANTVMATATAKVGLGQLPVNIFGVAEGVQIQGQIIDAETRKGIPGATFIVLRSEFGIHDFTWQMSQVFDLSYADADGYFALSKLLPRGQLYSIVVTAQGYLSAQSDGLNIDNKTKSPLEMPIELNRD